MRLAARLVVIALAMALITAVGWRVFELGLSDQPLAEDPRDALAWNPENPDALAAAAREHLAKGEYRQAEEGARSLLQREPANGSAFVILSDAARMQGDTASASEWSRVALRYAPDALAPRAWIASELLDSGNYAQALDNIDVMLRVWPSQRAQLFPVLIEFSRNAEFAEALAAKLMADPTWKGSMLAALLSKASPEALGQVLASMQRQRALDAATAARWFDRLAKEGNWGEAYARWVSRLDLGNSNRLRNIYNGGFELPPSNGGFDWRVGDSAGVVIERVSVAGASGNHAIALTFLGRRSESVPLHQWLLLSSGRYHLTYRANAEDLRGDRGLQWVVSCLPNGKELAASDLIAGDFDWSERAVEFEVPTEGCRAQNLWLRNAGTQGAGKILRGSIRFDDFAIEQRAIEGAVESH